MGHRLCSRRALHGGVQGLQVWHVHHDGDPLRVLRIHERPDVGGAKRSEQLLPLWRAEPMVLALGDVVIPNDGWHVVSFRGMRAPPTPAVSGETRAKGSASRGRTDSISKSLRGERSR